MNPSRETGKSQGHLRMPACATILVACFCCHAADWKVAKDSDGKTYPICESLAKRINSYPAFCQQDALATAPEFVRPDWKRIDASEHVELIAKLQRYRAGPEEYKQHPPSREILDAMEAQVVKDLKAGTIVLERLDTRSLQYSDQPLTYPTPDGPQTLVRVTYEGKTSTDTSRCPSKSEVAWDRPVYAVTPDLSGPDMSVDPGVASNFQAKRLVSYRDKYYLVGSDKVTPASLPADDDMLGCYFHR